MYWQSLNMTSFSEVKNQVKAVILPIGMTEAHGPHCPLGTDTLIPRELCLRIEAALGEQVVIAPEVPYGHSWSLAPFPGTVDIPAVVFSDYVLAIGRGILKQGLCRIVFLNGHGGNIPALTIAAEKLSDEGAAVLLINWWLDYSPDILEICDGQGHAGEDETSVIMAITPALVDMKLATFNWCKPSGNIKAKSLRLDLYAHAMTGDGTKATIEKGQQILNRITPKIISLIEKFTSLEP